MFSDICGKMKAVTFSYDDAVEQDIRLIEILNKYGLKGTFNLNSALLGQRNSIVREGVTIRHDKNAPENIRHIYEGHEIAAHTLTHPTLTQVADDAEIIRQVEEDRLRLSELAGYEVIGFAYPGGGINYNPRIADLIRKNTGVRYARTTVTTGAFDLEPDLFTFRPSAHHGEAAALAERFLEAKPTAPQIFYIWGHSFELDIHDTWAEFEELCKLLSGHDDVFYATNKEILL